MGRISNWILANDANLRFGQFRGQKLVKIEILEIKFFTKIDILAFEICTELQLLSFKLGKIKFSTFWCQKICQNWIFDLFQTCYLFWIFDSFDWTFSELVSYDYFRLVKTQHLSKIWKHNPSSFCYFWETWSQVESPYK